MNGSHASGKHKIPLEAVIEMMTRYRAQKESILFPEFAGRNLLPISETFERVAFDRLLAQPDCTSLRIYYGMDEALQLQAIVVGVNERNEDILPTATNPVSEIMEISKICPPYCAVASPLNP